MDKKSEFLTQISRRQGYDTKIINLTKDLANEFREIRKWLTTTIKKYEDCSPLKYEIRKEGIRRFTRLFDWYSHLESEFRNYFKVEAPASFMKISHLDIVIIVDKMIYPDFVPLLN